MTITTGIRSGILSGIRSGINPSMGGIGGLADSLYIIVGQSNAVGDGDYSGTVGAPALPLIFAQDSSEAYETPYPEVSLDTRITLNLTDPLVWTTVATRATQPYAAAGSVNMGIELSLARVLNTYGGPAFVGKFSVFASGLALHWLPSSTFPTSPSGGPNLYTQLVTYITTKIAESGKTLGGIFWIQGESDAQDSTRANAYAANMTTLFTALRAQFGAFTVVFSRLPNNAFNPFQTTVRTQQATYAAGDPLSVMVDTDDFVVPGGLHFDPRDLQTLGERMAMGMLQARHPVAASVPGVPSFVGAGPSRIKYNSATTIVRWPGQVVDGDVGILITLGSRGLFAVTAPTVPAGFTLITSVHSVSGADHVYAAAYWCRVTQAVLDANLHQMPSVTLNNTNFNNQGRIFVFRGCIGVVAPYDVIPTSVNNAFGTALSAAGATTTVPNTLIAAFLSGHVPSASSNKLPSVANTDLVGLTLQKTGQEASGGDGANYQMLSLATGTKASAGTFGPTTATYPIATLQANICLALKGGLAVSQDATSGIYCPETAAQWAVVLAAAGITSGGPGLLWLCQEAAGSLGDSVAGFVGTPSGTGITYQNAVTGWSRRAINTTDGGSGLIASTSIALPNIATTSCLLLTYSKHTTPGATRGSQGVGVNLSLEILAANTLRLFGTTATTGVSVTTGAVRPYVLKADRVLATANGYSDQEKIASVPIASVSGQRIGIGATVATSTPGQYLYAAAFFGTAAELSDAQIKTLLQTLGWTIPWT